MNNIIFSESAILDLKNKKGKLTQFKPGINIVTGVDIKGNWIGKSSLLRSLYHTLGADCKFSKKWVSQNDCIYILKFSFKNSVYTMIRLNRYFKLYKENKLQFEVADRENLANELNKVFNHSISLFSKSTMKYEIAKPAFSYVLNFVDQQSNNEFEFDSFNYLTEFDDFRDATIYSHLGFPQSMEASIREEINSLEGENKMLNIKKSTFSTMINEIESTKTNGCDLVSLENMNKKLEEHKIKYRTMLDEAEKVKIKLYKCYQNKSYIEKTIFSLSTYIKKHELNTRKIAKTHRCPTCDSELMDESYAFFNEANDEMSYKLELVKTKEKLLEIENLITKCSNDYNDKLKEIEKFENDVVKSEKILTENINGIGLRALNNNLTQKLQKTINSIETNQTNINDKKSELRSLTSQKSKVNALYKSIFAGIAHKYSLPIDASQIENVSSKIKLNSTENLLVNVAWILSLLKTKEISNKDATNYPLVIDNPNNADLDKTNEKKIFKMMFENVPHDTQIITSRAFCEKEDFVGFNINKIILPSNQYSLLNGDDYNVILREYADFINS